MPLEEHREQVPVLSFPRQTIVSLLVFAVCWEVLSHLSPYLDQRWYQWNKTALTKPDEVETTDAPASSAMSKIPGHQGGLL